MSHYSRIEAQSALSHELLQRGGAHVVDMCAVRASAGLLWPAIQQGIHDRMAHILSIQLGPSDSYERLDDTRYLIVTPREDNPGLIAVRVICELLKSLNGKCDLGEARVDRAEDYGSTLRGAPLRLDQMARLADQAQIPDLILPPHLRRPGQQYAPNDHQTVSRSTLTVEHGFEPVWNARHEAVTTYLCQPKRIFCSNASQIDLDINDLTVRERAIIEMQGLLTGAGHLTTSVERGDRFLLGIPLSFDTMCSPYGRAEFVTACRGLPADYRQYLTFLLTGIPLGVTYSRLTDLAMALRPFGRVIAGVASGCRNFNAYEGHGFNAIAFDLKNASEDADRTRADIVHIGAAGRNMHWGAMILNVGDAQMFNIANAADCQQIHGQVISPALPAPRRMTHIPASAFIQRSEDSGSEEWFD